jgi:hypothetical protein
MHTDTSREKERRKKKEKTEHAYARHFLPVARIGRARLREIFDSLDCRNEH